MSQADKLQIKSSSGSALNVVTVYNEAFTCTLMPLGEGVPAVTQVRHQPRICACQKTFQVRPAEGHSVAMAVIANNAPLGSESAKETTARLGIGTHSNLVQPY